MHELEGALGSVLGYDPSQDARADADMSEQMGASKIDQ
jgi:hypothetical protein